MLTHAGVRKMNTNQEITTIRSTPAKVGQQFDIENLNAEEDQSDKATLAACMSSLQGALENMSKHIEVLTIRTEMNLQIFNSRFAEIEHRLDQVSPKSSEVPAQRLVIEQATPNIKAHSLCGKPQVFDGKNLDNFLLVLDNYITSNAVTGSAQKISILVSYLGSAITTYRAWAMDNPFGSYDEFVNHLRIMYGPTPSCITAKVKFRNMKRKPETSFEQFLTELQDVAIIAYKEEDLRTINNSVIEQFLLGLQMPKVQDVLMSEDFTTPIELLVRAQKVRDGFRIVHSASSGPKIHAISENMTQSSSSYATRCWKCDTVGHRAFECRRPPLNHKPSGNGSPGMFRGSANPEKQN